MATKHPNVWPIADGRQPRAVRAFTLVEMLVAMAITLVMMAAVVTLFANVSNSVRNRRATIEMSGQLRHLRNVLQQDLQGATCPGVTWQRPESNHGYIEIIEGQYREGNASNLINGAAPPTAIDPEIDHKLSTIPSSNMPFADANWVTDAAGLGDHDDVLMLTVRNEHEPFVGRMPTNVRRNATRANPFVARSGEEGWEYGTIESPLAEVVWYAVENPGYTDDPDVPADGESDPSAEAFFGEPGMRTIYRRALLIAPWVNPYRFVASDGTIHDTFTLDQESVEFQARPGLVRVLSDIIERPDLHEALACLVAFQERYDLSVRLEFDPNLDPPDGRYVILANTLSDLTKRENRYEHHSYRRAEGTSQPASRDYPYAALSMGSGYSGSNPAVRCQPDVESPNDPPPNDFPPNPADEGEALTLDVGGLPDVVVAYTLENPFPTEPGVNRRRYKWRPFAYVDDESDTLATARVVLNDNHQVVRIVHGFVPLSGERRGEDVMMTGVLAFDLRLYDPGAPLFATVRVPGLPLTNTNQSLDVVLTPSDPAWRGLPTDPPTIGAYIHDDNMKLNGTGEIGTGNTSTSPTFPYMGQGAYVDLGYGYDVRWRGLSIGALKAPIYRQPDFVSSTGPWFFAPALEMSVSQFPNRIVEHGGALCDVFGRQLAPGYSVYDTWSFHYENNGMDEDADGAIDEGTDGMDGVGHYFNPSPPAQPPWTIDDMRLGVDDVGERETAPPYDKPLRGVQVLIRSYEPDSRAIRQVRVNQHFMPE